MDIIESSHFEVVKQWLQDHPYQEFKAQKKGPVWRLTLIQTRTLESLPIVCEALTFGSALKLMSKRLNLTPGDTNEHSSSNS